MMTFFAYIPFFLHLTSSAYGDNGLFHIDRATKFTTAPVTSYNLPAYQHCVFKCITENVCVAFSYNTVSAECGLFHTNPGRSAANNYIVGISGKVRGK